MRAIGCCDWRTSANPLFARFETLKLHDIYTLEVAKFVKQTLLGRLPPYFLDYYHKFKTYTAIQQDQPCTII